MYVNREKIININQCKSVVYHELKNIIEKKLYL